MTSEQEDIMVRCSIEFSVSVEEVLSEKRHKNMVLARHCTMKIFREYLRMSFPDIGRAFNRDHSTAMYGIKKFNKLLDKDDLIKTKYIKLCKEVMIPLEKQGKIIITYKKDLVPIHDIIREIFKEIPVTKVEIL